MSVKNFLRERAGNKELLHEIKSIILEDSPSSINGFRKSGVSSIEDFVDLFMNMGNMAYHTGDIELFDEFIGALFELIDSGSDEIDSEQMMRYIYNYGAMAARGLDIYPFVAIMKNLVFRLYEEKGVEEINESLRVIRSMALKSDKSDFELGTMEVVDALKEINDHLLSNELHVNRVYLQNIVISLVYSSERNQHEDTKTRILEKAYGILRVRPVKRWAEPETSEGPSAPEQIEAPTTDVVQ